ncbi:hypothetical protein FIBSPDRAFT_929756 [Athelia psychrophila]|uniref:Helitron helicase-like domain-containing protein n=1 Tax=Athelia psychrophila TaxID=1759441 RepID=A0A166N152_9AGAM|nr:hypothetical protein FIBSPDRAFT_929756 [Fibularhizoctonia sp. CBS 109695]
MTAGSSSNPPVNPVTPRSLRRQQDRAARESEWSPSINRRQPSSPLFSITNDYRTDNQQSRTLHQPATSGLPYSGIPQPFPRLPRTNRHDENDPFVTITPIGAPPLATSPASATGSAPNKRSIAQQERRARERREKAAPLTPVSPPRQRRNVNPRRSASQLRRRVREERERQANRQPSPGPSTQDATAAHPPPMAQVLATNDMHGDLSNEGAPEPPEPPLPAPTVHRAREAPPARRAYQEPITRHDLGRMDIPCVHCGALHWIDERLADSSLRTPKFGSCCAHGQVQLEPLQDPPYPLQQLFLGLTPQSREFLENIRQYNAAFAFTSLGVVQDHAVNAGIGPYIFRIHGELCHRAGALLPQPGQMPSYAQLYIHDPQAALQYRSNRNGNVRADTMQILQGVISDSHYYAHLYKHAFEVLQEHGEVPDVHIRLRCAPNQDRRRYNLPTADEVAVILPGDGSQPTDSRDIILRLRWPDGPLQRISDGHPAYASLHYVLLFPHGEDGWHWELRMHDPEKEQPRRLSQIRHCAYRIHPRAHEFNIILRGGRLFQQYMVDMWASADQNRLNFLRSNQSKIRASLYSGLEDAVGAADRDINLAELGRRFILPSSYTGGPRYMQQCLQDSLALARFYRKIDLFITVTCNPQWDEIQRELLPGQKASDRPDLVARVFALKKKAIIDYITKGAAFGGVVAHVYTIEFQKRGLPHMHLLVFLEQPMA